MEKSNDCNYNSRMNLFAYLADKDRCRKFLRSGLNEVRRRTAVPLEEADDIVSEALERLLDYYARKPEKLLLLESMAEEEMNNYLKKALRNHIINTIKKRHRHYFLSWEEAGEPPAPKGNGSLTNELDVQSIREELHYFVEEQFGREKWPRKKEAVDLFVERIGGKITMGELQRRYPGKSIAVMNTEAHRIVKKYARWARDRGRSLDGAFNGENL